MKNKWWGIIGGLGVISGVGSWFLFGPVVAPKASAAPRPINMNTYVPTDLAAAPLTTTLGVGVNTSRATAIASTMAYIDKLYPASARTMSISVTSVRLEHARSVVPKIGNQNLWLVAVSGIPNQWSQLASSPYSASLFIVSAQTGHVLEQVLTGPLTGHLG